MEVACWHKEGGVKVISSLNIPGLKPINALELDFKLFFFVDSGSAYIVLEESK